MISQQSPQPSNLCTSVKLGYSNINTFLSGCGRKWPVTKVAALKSRGRLDDDTVDWLKRTALNVG